MQMLNVDLLRSRLPDYRAGYSHSAEDPLREYLRCYGLQLILDAGHRLEASQQTVLGCALFVQHYRTRHQVCGTVVVVHGYFDHSGLYKHLISYLLEIGWDVLVFDLPGHGLSEGKPLAIDAFSTYAAQLTELLDSRREQLAAPWALLGQSTGAAILMTQQLAYGYHRWPVSHQVLLAPLVRPCGWQKIVRQYRWLRFFLRKVKRTYGVSSGDQAFLDFVRYQDPLQHPYVPVKWIGAMLRWIEEIEQAASLTTRSRCVFRVLPMKLSNGGIIWG